MGSECVRQYKRQHSRKSKVDNDQPLSTTNQGTSSSGDQINRVSDDTSSEISTDQSKVNSLDPAPEDSNDEETLIDNTNHHIQFNNYQQMDISCSERLSPSSTIDRPSDEKDSYQENREARRLARKMQKKAEKKALKKAAKREAKRLAKEKRAERRARREAKRELKRLHKLEKSRLTEQENLNFDVQESNTRNPDVNQESSSNHAWDDNQWSPASHSEPVQTNEDSTDSSSNRPILPTLDDRCASPLQFMHQPDDDSIFSTHQNDYSSSNGELLTKEINFSNTTPLEYDKHQYSTGIKRTGILFHSNGSDNESSQLLNGGTIKLENSEIPPKKKAKTVLMKNNDDDDDDDVDDEDTMCRPEMKIMSSSKSNSHHSQTNNEKDVKQSAAVIEAADSLVVEASDNSKPTIPEPLPEAVTKHGVVTTTSNNNKKRSKSVQQRSRLRKKKPNAILLDSDEDEMNSEKKVINLRDSSPSSLSSPSPLSLSNDSDIENSKSKDQLSSQLKEKSRNSSPKPSTINKSNRARKSRNQKSNQKTNNNNLKVKRKQSEVKPTAASNTSVQDEKRISNDSSGIRQAAASNDPVTQLNQCCRDLKTSLIKGHENFAEAVQLLNKVRSIPVRLPQLAEAWDLMDCIKKCRRYKLSNEVREAAQTTFQFFQSLQANTTKEELSQAQALIASHQNRIHSVQDSVMENTSKTDSLSISADVDNKQTLQNNTNSNNSSESTSDNTTTNTTTTITIEPENLTADLEAKVDDVLSRIRATEERMAAAAVSSTRSDTPYKSISNHVTNSSIRSTGGRIIRASAVAAATAHMHDEEDEESVMSRVEQVAAYEAGAINYPNPTSLGSPPPPPPPPPSLSFGSVGPSDQLEAKASPSVDHLDLDSRIQLFMSAASSQKSAKSSNSKPVVTVGKSEMTPTTRSHHIQPNLTSVTSSTSSASTLSSTVALSSSSSLLPVLLAKRKVIADKLAAVKASGSPIKSCHPVTSPLPSPTSINNEFNIVEKVSSSVTTTPASTTTATTIHTPPLLTKMSNTAKMPSKDEELYDLLGV
ncbi:unnamed protein product [Schistosoma bovis]|nr:unnamed protein product [Schistosoma bovis]